MKGKEINSVTVFCGSSIGILPDYQNSAKELGRKLAAEHITLIYGGASKGLMGVLSNEMMRDGGKVIGIIPEILSDKELKNDRLSELIVTIDMHSRKKMLYQKGDAFIVLPGGLGTMDEFFEAVTWNQIGIYQKEIFIINTAGYWDPLIALIENMSQNGFLYKRIFDLVTVVSSPNEIHF